MPAPGGEHPVQLLRRLAAWERQLPPAPWRPVERSDLAHRGPAEFDPDVDLDRAAFDRAEQVRSQTAAWRGLVDADGNELVGQSLPGGTPQTVNDPVWRFLAELRNALPELLTFTRQLWRQAASRHRSDRPGALQPPARCGDGADTDPEVVVRAAQAAYEVHSPPVPWPALPDAARNEWCDRAGAALRAAGCGPV